MADFRYHDGLNTDRDKIRFHIQDTVEDSGPKPDGANFTDNELAGLLTIEGTWQKTVAACYEVLEAAWADYADISVGSRRESFSQIADRYARKAAKWRSDFGSTATTRAGTRHPTRIDGYSNDVASDEQ
jgi:hypothetical protein